MKPCELIECIEKTAPLSLAASWDACGVQVAAFRDTVSHLSVMLDPTPRALAAAIEAGSDFILTHHPFSLKPRFPNRVDTYLSTLSLLLANRVWLYSAHTSLDANPQGPAQWLAGELHLDNVVILDPAGDGYGFGFIGNLPAPLPYAAFAEQLSGALGRDHWQSCGHTPTHVRRVACCPGSGSDLARIAATAGADVFITGDVKYHAALEAPVRMIDVGHFSLEEEMMRRFAEILRLALPLPVTFFPGIDPLAGECPPFT